MKLSMPLHEILEALKANAALPEELSEGEGGFNSCSYLAWPYGSDR
jgi:hypothetical protein